MIIRLEQNERTVHWAEDRDIQSEIIIGRSADCSWRLALDDRSVGRRHAALHRQGGEIWIRDLGSLNGLRCGDEAIRSRRLASGDRLRLGDALLVVEDSPVDPASSAGSTRVLQLAELRWNQPVNGQRSTPILSFPCIVGSGEGVGLRVRDEFVSREHAAIDLGADGQLTLADLGSRNGTRVNGQPLTQGRTHRLRNGDVIHFGRQRAEFCEADPADAAAANRFMKGPSRLRPFLNVAGMALAALTLAACLLAVWWFWPCEPGPAVRPLAAPAPGDLPAPPLPESPPAPAEPVSATTNAARVVEPAPPQSGETVAAGILSPLPAAVEAALAALTNLPPQPEPVHEALNRARPLATGKDRERLDRIQQSLKLIEEDVGTVGEYLPKLWALETQALEDMILKTEEKGLLDPHPCIQAAAQKLHLIFRELKTQTVAVRTHVTAFKRRQLALEKAFPQGLKTWEEAAALSRALDGDGMDLQREGRAETGEASYGRYFGPAFLYRVLSRGAGQGTTPAADADEQEEPATLLRLSIEAARAADEALAFFNQPLNARLQYGAIAERTKEMRQLASDRDTVVEGLRDLAARSKGRRKLIASGAALLLQGQAGANTPAAAEFAAQWREHAAAVTALSERHRRATGVERQALENDLRALAVPGDPVLRIR